MRRAVRRLAVSALALAVVQVPAAPGPVGAHHGAARPNVLIIMTDDQRLDQMSKKVVRKTRRWFRRGGTHYPFAFATTPLCCPSRASVMTGQYAHNTNVEKNTDAARLDQRATMQRYLQDVGYRTAIVGKYLNTWDADPPFFHDWAIFRHRRAGYYGATFNIGGTSRKVKRYSTDFIGAQALRLLRSYEGNDEQPWMMYVTPFTPHSPYDPHKKDRKARVPKYRRNPAVREKDRTDKPQWVQEKRNGGVKRGRKTWKAQNRMLLSLDRVVNRVMRGVRKLGEENQTLVFFLSDNGFLLGEHGLHQKHSPYWLSLQLPFFARWPGHLGAGVADPRVTANIDIAPTVYDAAGITPDPEHPVDGRSLLEPSERDHVLLEYVHRPGRAVPSWASYRAATYQYTEYYDEDAETVIFREYYDLVADPWQVTNLLADGDPSNDPPPEQLTHMEVRLRSDRRCQGNDGPATCP